MIAHKVYDLFGNSKLHYEGRINLNYCLGIIGSKYNGFMEPKGLVDFIYQNDKSGLIKGLEVNLDISNVNEVKFYRNVAKECQRKDWNIQFHAPDPYMLDMEHMISVYDSFSKCIEKPIEFTIHPHTKMSTLDENISKTITDFKLLSEKISKSNADVRFSVENLNMLNGIKRINLDSIDDILGYSDHRFCWDIGHSIFDGIMDLELSGIQMERLNNIHLHDIDSFTDHLPFVHGNVDLVKATTSLHQLGYNGNVVVELRYEDLAGTDTSQKIISFISEINKIDDAKKRRKCMNYKKCSYCGELQHEEEVVASTEHYFRANGFEDYSYNRSDDICPSCGIPMDQGSF